MPLGGLEVPAPQSTAQKLRSMRMNTNATPGREEQPAQLAQIDNSDPAQATDEATQPLSPQFAALAKQRRALQVKEREIADREKALSTASTQGAGIDMARLKADPLGVMLGAGLTFEDLTQAVLNHGSGSEVRAIEAKLKALEEGVDKKLTDRDRQSEQQALAEMRKEALRLVAQGDEFELVRETKSVPLVMELIEKTYRETGEVLDVRVALRLVEDERVKEGLRFAGYSKVQGQLAPRPAQPQQPQRQMRTLTNRDTAAPVMDRRARALAAALGTLKR